MPMALSGICWNYILIRCASSILWLCFCHSVLQFVVFFFLEISNQNELLTITWIERLEFYFQNLAKEVLEWWPNLGKQDKIYFCFIYMYILFFSGVNNIPDGFSDNWKEAKFNKIDPYQSGFFPLTETISFHFSFSQCCKHCVQYTYHR